MTFYKTLVFFQLTLNRIIHRIIPLLNCDDDDDATSVLGNN